MQCFAVSSLAGAPFRVSARTSVRSVAARRMTVVRAGDSKTAIKEKSAEVVDSLNTTTQELLDKAQAYWEASEEKPTIVAVAAGTLLAIYFAGTVVDAVDRLPLLSTLFELVGLAFTGWTAYRFFLVDGEKDKITDELKGFTKKVGIDL